MTSPQRAALLDALTVERAAPRPKPWSNPRRDYQAEIDARRAEQEHPTDAMQEAS